MRFLYDLITNMIKRCRIVSVDDTQDLRMGYISFLGKRQKAYIFTPYGLDHNPPSNSDGFCFALQGKESNMIGLFDSPETRKKNLKAGEVAVGNTVTGSFVFFKENGDIDIFSNGNVNINSTTLTHNGKNIGSDHKHSGVTPGGDNTGDPI